MSPTTIKITESTQKKFSTSHLEKFVNSRDFEDIVLWYHMQQAKTGKSQSFADFKNELWL